MAKARSPKEKSPEAVTPEVQPRPVRGATRKVRPEAPRRTGRREPDEPVEREVEGGGRDEAPESDEPAVRPVLTAISRPIRDDELQDARAAGEEPAATLPPAPPSPEAPTLTEARPGEPMQVISLNDLKRMKITELSKMAHSLDIEGAQGLKKQDLLFAILSGIADKRYEVHAEGVVELLSDGFGFMRSADSDYQPSPDDIYVSPSQVRRYNLRPGDTVNGPIRQPREGERFFALQRVDKINFVDPLGAEVKERILFDNLTPLYPTRKLKLEHESG